MNPNKEEILISSRFVVKIKGKRLMRITLPAIWSELVINLFHVMVINGIKEINEKRYGVEYGKEKNKEEKI